MRAEPPQLETQVPSIMKSSNHEVIDSVSKWLNDGEYVWFATIVKTYGSSPRPVGSLMAISACHGVVGSISGGCLEEDFLNRIKSGALEKEYLDAGRPLLIKFGESAEEQVRLRLPCGGELHVVVERLDGQQESIRFHFEALASSLRQRQISNRLLDLSLGGMQVLDAEEVTKLGFNGQSIEYVEDQKLYCQFGPNWQLLIIGAGEVARYIAEFSQTIDFKITLCDPREEFVLGWEVEGVEVQTCFPDDLIRERFFDSHSAVIAVAHDPRVDDMGLMEALKTDAFYVGAMGSERTSQLRRERLPELEVSAEQLTKLHAPVGLPVKSKTPAEIAISIVAHLIQEKNSHSKRSI